MGRKALARLYDVIVKDPERAVLDVFRVIVVTEAKEPVGL
jgi:hypothetical protein